MKGGIMLFETTVLFSLLVSALAAETRYFRVGRKLVSFDIYTDREAFENALTCPNPPRESFEDTTFIDGLTVDSSFPDATVSGGVWLDYLENSFFTLHYYATTITYAPGSTAFGGNWDFGPNSSSHVTGISVMFNGVE
jgi:hypothetical protein